LEGLIGAGLALTISAFATCIGFDRDRAFYPTMLIVIASCYGLFAIMGGSNQALAKELVPIAVFLLLSVLGFKRNLWIVAGALIAHGTFDVFHGHLISNPGVPAWWPVFCMTYDITAGAYLAWRLNGSRISA
jgi:hypothetical protein